MLKIKIPTGYLMVEAKGIETEYPGVFVSFSESGKETGTLPDDLIACVEFDTFNKEIRTSTYKNSQDEPTHIIRHEDGTDIVCG